MSALGGGTEPGTGRREECQDHHVADLIGEDQIWVSGDWAGRFGLTADPDDTGYGHTPRQVAAVRPESAQALVDYHLAVAARTRTFLTALTPADLDRVVDEAWDPPVTLGVRLVSVVEDDLQHVGQAAYVRGLLTPG
ncbi:mycothiol transferase [Micromonospora citrea]|uniref:mycothiol transferase n=1 Tax=Micromonospora citrea TaxID=47855 RepID=UPI003C477092